MNTPRILSGGMLFILALGVVLSVQVFRVALNVNSLATGLREVRLPSVETAHHIKGAIADMDASIADAFAKQPGKRSINSKTLSRQSEAIRNVILAAVSTSSDTAEEQKLLIELALHFNNYTNQIAVAVSNSDIDGYYRASRTMHIEVIPLADKIIAINEARLSDGFKNANSYFRQVVVIACLALLELVLLVLVQMYLIKRTRRFINVPLALSTTLLAGAIVTGLTISAGVNNQLVSARRHFDSIDNLWATRAMYYDIYGDTIRSVLRPDKKSMENLSKKKDKILRAELDKFDQISNQVLENKISPPPTDGYLLAAALDESEEMERKLVAASIRALKVFLEQSAIIIQEAQKGDQAASLADLRSEKDSGVIQRLNSLDELIGKAIYLNKESFDYSTKSAGTYLGLIEFAGVALCIIAALLAGIGINLRRAEFS